MLVDCQKTGTKELSELSLEIGIRNAELLIKEENVDNENKKYIEMIMEFFDAVIQFCDKKHITMENGVTGLEAFNLFISALETVGVEAKNIVEVQEQASEYYDIIKKLKVDDNIDQDERLQLANLLRVITVYFENFVGKTDQNEQWRF
ncbi:MAG: hypothetical protein ACOCRO_05145 [Halanaerobiales bacterium]